MFGKPKKPTNPEMVTATLKVDNQKRLWRRNAALLFIHHRLTTATSFTVCAWWAIATLTSKQRLRMVSWYKLFYTDKPWTTQCPHLRRMAANLFLRTMHFFALRQRRCTSISIEGGGCSVRALPRLCQRKLLLPLIYCWAPWIGQVGLVFFHRSVG